MKKTLISLVSFFALLVASAGPSLAATLNIDLTNGGLGQAVSNPQQFGIAVCNDSAQTLSTSVPVSVTVGSQSATISTPASITAKNCQYTYINYSQFGMQAGQTYTVAVVIDPRDTVIAHGGEKTTYTVTVPAQTTVAAKVNAGNLTANISTQVTNPLVAAWNWFIGLFKGL